MSHAFSISALVEECILCGCGHSTRTTVIAYLEKNLVIASLGIRILEQVVSDLVPTAFHSYISHFLAYSDKKSHVYSLTHLVCGNT